MIALVLAGLLGLALTACRPPVPATESAPPAARVPTDGPSDKVHSGEPTIDFDARTHDFGVVNEGPPIKHAFQIKNRGTAPLVLSNASTSCGCTAATLDVTTIPPGGSGLLAVTMDTHGERGPGAKAITVNSNDPREPTSTLEIRYDVQPLLDLDRSFVQLTTKKGLAHAEKVWLTGQLARQANLRVIGMVDDGARLVVARPIVVASGGQSRKGIELVLRGQNSKRPVSGDAVVTLRTGLSSPSELVLRLAYQVR
jgi:hypothetical protein